MKKFEFSLDRLLKVKRQQERLAEMEQQRAKLAADAARDRLAALHADLVRVSDATAARLGQAVSPGAWVAAYELSERLGRAIQVGEQTVAQADQRFAAAAEERARIATEAEAMATLRQQQWEKWRHEYAAAEQERVDEFGLRKWMAAQTARAGAA